MMKAVVEVRFYRGPKLQTVLSARCRAHTSSPSVFTGDDVDRVLEDLIEHLREHVISFGDGPREE